MRTIRVSEIRRQAIVPDYELQLSPAACSRSLYGSGRAFAFTNYRFAIMGRISRPHRSSQFGKQNRRCRGPRNKPHNRVNTHADVKAFGRKSGTATYRAGRDLFGIGGRRMEAPNESLAYTEGSMIQTPCPYWSVWGTSCARFVWSIVLKTSGGLAFVAKRPYRAASGITWRSASRASCWEMKLSHGPRR